MTLSFSVNWDYRCPFARIAHDHVVTALRSEVDWEVTFRAFSLDQAHVEEGGTPVWDEPERYPGLLANLAGIVVRDRIPHNFLSVHSALFSARHDRALDTRQPDVVSEILTGAGLDAAPIMAEIKDGWPLQTLRREHSADVDELEVFGVPTFVVGDHAAFVRLMERPEGDAALATFSVERILGLLDGWPELNEFKHTRVGR